MFLVKNLCCLLKRKASVGRTLRLGDVSCILMKLVLFTYLYGLGGDEGYDSKMFLVKI